jgi:hypothetical protein
MSRSLAKGTRMSGRVAKRASPACAAVAIGLLAALAAVAAPSANVASTDTAAAEDIRDIRGPKGMLPAWLVPALVAGTALLAAAGYAAWRWKHRRRASPALQPFEIALRRLDEIRALMKPSSVREFSIAISDTVRRYIEDAFEVTATHRTTEEFLRDLLESSNASLATHRSLLAQFLEQCDMAKFAGVSLSEQIMESLHQSARSFVIESSKPLPAAQVHGGPAVAASAGAP